MSRTLIESGLTYKQQRFVEEYLVDFNGARAAREAGYSKKTAFRIAEQNLKKPLIAAEIAKRKQKLTEKTELSVEWVLDNLKEIVDRGMKEAVITDPTTGNDLMIPVEINGEKKLVKAFSYDPKSSTKALELIGKYLKMFTEKIEHSGDMTIDWKEEKTYVNNPKNTG